MNRFEKVIVCSRELEISDKKISISKIMNFLKYGIKCDFRDNLITLQKTLGKDYILYDNAIVKEIDLMAQEIIWR